MLINATDVIVSLAYDYTNSLHEFDDYVLQDKMLDPNSAKFSFDCYAKEEQRQEPTCSPYWGKTFPDCLIQL